jgi:soluble lytic murein transglycosylase-like protein
MPSRRILAGGAALSLAALALTAPASAALPGAALEQDARQQAYAAAAAEYGVPVDVLLGVSYLESGGTPTPARPVPAADTGPCTSPMRHRSPLSPMQRRR